MMSLINKPADWPHNYHKAARRFPKFHGHIKTMNKLTLNEAAIKVGMVTWFIETNNIVKTPSEKILNTYEVISVKQMVILH